MITFTETARQKVREYMDMSEDSESRCASGCAPIWPPPVPLRAGSGDWKARTPKTDVVVDQEVFEVYLDPQSAEFIEGTTVDFVSDVSGTGFMFNNPQAEVKWDDPLAQRVQKVIDERISPVARGPRWLGRASRPSTAMPPSSSSAVVVRAAGCRR